MARKRSHPSAETTVPARPLVESEEKKQQRLDAEFWKSYEAASSKYSSAVNAAWRKYEVALKTDLSENPKRHDRMPYDDQYEADIKAAVDEWDTYFNAP